MSSEPEYFPELISALQAKKIQYIFYTRNLPLIRKYQPDFVVAQAQWSLAQDLLGQGIQVLTLGEKKVKDKAFDILGFSTLETDSPEDFCIYTLKKNQYIQNSKVNPALGSFLSENHAVINIDQYQPSASALWCQYFDRIRTLLNDGCNLKTIDFCDLIYWTETVFLEKQPVLPSMPSFSQDEKGFHHVWGVARPATDNKSITPQILSQDSLVLLWTVNPFLNTHLNKLDFSQLFSRLVQQLNLPAFGKTITEKNSDIFINGRKCTGGLNFKNGNLWAGNAGAYVLYFRFFPEERKLLEEYCPDRMADYTGLLDEFPDLTHEKIMSELLKILG